MPDLNGLRCAIELGPDKHPVEELKLQYGNKQVNCTISVPKHDINFCIHFTASEHSPAALAVFVFIDGQYQANRNYVSTGGFSDFRLRQKEEVAWDGTHLIGRDWRFASLKTTWSDPPHVAKSLLDNLGTIEVVVLRCAVDRGVSASLATDPQHDVNVLARQRSWSYLPPSYKPHFDPYMSHRVGLDGMHDSPGIIHDGDVHDYHAWTRRATGHEHTHAATSGSHSMAGNPMHSSKPHWKHWKVPDARYGHGEEALPAVNKPRPRDPHIFQEYARPTIYAGFAQKNGLNVQAVTGKGALYTLPLATPQYLDTMDKPFAVFTFKYRCAAGEHTLAAKTPQGSVTGSKRRSDADRQSSHHGHTSRYDDQRRHTSRADGQDVGDTQQWEWPRASQPQGWGEWHKPSESKHSAASVAPSSGMWHASRAGSASQKGSAQAQPWDDSGYQDLHVAGGWQEYDNNATQNVAKAKSSRSHKSRKDAGSVQW